MQQNIQTSQQEIEAFYETLRQKKKELGMTNSSISTISGVPESTVQKFFNGTTPSPSFDTVIGIARALDVSLDDAFGITPVHDTPETMNNPDNLLNRCTGLLVRSNQRIFALYDKEMRNKDIRNYILSGVLLLLLVLDLMIGSRGWIIYDTLIRARDIAAGFVSDLFAL